MRQLPFASVKYGWETCRHKMLNTHLPLEIEDDGALSPTSGNQQVPLPLQITCCKWGKLMKVLYKQNMFNIPNCGYRESGKLNLQLYTFLWYWSMLWYISVAFSVLCNWDSVFLLASVPIPHTQSPYQSLTCSIDISFSFVSPHRRPKDAIRALRKRLSKNCNHVEIRLTLSVSTNYMISIKILSNRITGQYSLEQTAQSRGAPPPRRREE